MDQINLKLLYQQTLEVIKLAAAPAYVQLNQCPIQTCRPDEVALTVDEILSNIDLLSSNNLIGEETANSLKELNDFYATFNMDDWTEKAMFTSANWEKSRILAQKIMCNGDLNFEIPNLFWIEDII